MALVVVALLPRIESIKRHGTFSKLIGIMKVEINRSVLFIGFTYHYLEFKISFTIKTDAGSITDSRRYNGASNNSTLIHTQTYVFIREELEKNIETL